MSQRDGRVELDTSVGYLLKETASALRSAMESVLRPLDLTLTQYACLELLAQRPGLSNSELARGAFVTRQSMNVLLQQLQRDEMVKRAQTPQAGRALPAELTALGWRRLDEASVAVRSVEARMVSNLDSADEQRLRDLLSSCAGSLRPASRA